MTNGKTVFFYAIITGVFLLLLVFGYKVYQIKTIKARVWQETKSLPDLPFYFPYGGNVFTNKPIIINYFSPECEHCQYMATQIVSHSTTLTSAHLLLITAANLTDAAGFMSTFKLDSLPFVTLGLDTNNVFFRKFGSNTVPSFYIYNAQHNLVRKIMGETKIENIIDAINAK
ncbi:hypothetical protein QTN47_13320 [Danxiaibacter flavus]|uniref:Thioredoxin domain-containing protein n=1 Tax=Danxiaibacter flavus TaxID=3049108 RepID=A0ABV3ZF22_9BACT|nr:hypothetical protein QNM32_13325 [Chitinophagaceae bacterium DXS]